MQRGAITIHVQHSVQKCQVYRISPDSQHLEPFSHFESLLLSPLPTPFASSTYLHPTPFLLVFGYLYSLTHFYLCILYQGECLTVFIMGSQDRPSFFCSRPDGTLTPLLAVDDLPLTLSVRNVSRTLTPGDTQGMTSCGVAAPRSDLWVVDGPPTGSRIVNDEKMNELHALLFKILREEDVGCEIRSSIQEILFRGFDTHSSVPLPAPSAIVAACQTPQVAPHFRYGGNFQGGNPQGNHKHVSCYFTG